MFSPHSFAVAFRSPVAQTMPQVRRNYLGHYLTLIVFASVALPLTNSFYILVFQSVTSSQISGSIHPFEGDT